MREGLRQLIQAVDSALIIFRIGAFDGAPGVGLTDHKVAMMVAALHSIEADQSREDAERALRYVAQTYFAERTAEVIAFRGASREARPFNPEPDSAA